MLESSNPRSIAGVLGLAAGTLAAVATLSGCAGERAGFGLAAASASRDSSSHREKFKYTGAEQSFKVPSGVTSIDVDAFGAEGSGLLPTSSHTYIGLPGYGGRVRATIPVRPGQTLRIFVGGSGHAGGGFNGGGDGAYRGGGATDLRMGGDALTARILVAGGGGGLGPGLGGGGQNGGGGGGRKGRDGLGGSSGDAGLPGKGGTQHEGGAGGARGSKKADAGTAGTLGIGGNGGVGHSTRYIGDNGSGGGGGYYGGGGGGGGGPLGNGGAGGGGSGYAESSATNVQMWQNFRKADGLVVISW